LAAVSGENKTCGADAMSPLSQGEVAGVRAVRLINPSSQASPLGGEKEIAVM